MTLLIFLPKIFSQIFYFHMHQKNIFEIDYLLRKNMFINSIVSKSFPKIYKITYLRSKKKFYIYFKFNTNSTKNMFSSFTFISNYIRLYTYFYFKFNVKIDFFKPNFNENNSSCINYRTNFFHIMIPLKITRINAYLNYQAELKQVINNLKKFYKLQHKFNFFKNFINFKYSIQLYNQLFVNSDIFQYQSFYLKNFYNEICNSRIKMIYNPDLLKKIAGVYNLTDLKYNFSKHRDLKPGLLKAFSFFYKNIKYDVIIDIEKKDFVKVMVYIKNIQYNINELDNESYNIIMLLFLSRFHKEYKVSREYIEKENIVYIGNHYTIEYYSGCRLIIFISDNPSRLHFSYK